MMTADEFRRLVEKKPWRLGAAGPDAWDCWHLFRAFQVEVMGRPMPDIPDASSARLRAFIGHPDRLRWVETATPRIGDAIEFRRGASPVHIGVWLRDDGGSILHAVEGERVQVERLTHIRAQGIQHQILTPVE